jgi:hyperosmotically inducible periplasmic protein
MKKMIFTALLTLGLAGSAFAADRTDLQVFNDVAKQVNRYAYFTIFDSVHADVDDGVVVLTGKVTMPYKASEIEKRVAKVSGVTLVRNKIEVLPVSQFDNDLRQRIARALYANPALQMYGLGPNPSIHVIVERGHVTLDGVVNNDADRTIAMMVARQFGSFGEVRNNLKTNEEAKNDLEKL